MALITLLIVAASPVGGVFALGTLSGLAVVGIIGGGALLLWNVGYAIVNAFRSGGGEPLSTVPDSSTHNIGSFVGTTSTNTQQSTLGYPSGQIFQPGTQPQTTASPVSTTSSTSQTPLASTPNKD